jgi:hypothetical protein
MKINVPYYAQSSEFTCGPACVLMALKYFNPVLKLNRAGEFEVWRQCNMIGVKGADPYGLCVPLLDAGLGVRLLTQRRRMVDAALWKQRRLLRGKPLTSDEVRLALFGMAGNRKRALGRGLPVECRRPTIDRIARGMNDGLVPIALVHMGVVHGFDIPHWVVITDVGEDHVAFNDPYPPKGRKGIRLRHAEFQKIIDDIESRTGLSPSVIFVGSHPIPSAPA